MHFSEPKLKILVSAPGPRTSGVGAAQKSGGSATLAAVVLDRYDLWCVVSPREVKDPRPYTKHLLSATVKAEPAQTLNLKYYIKT